MEVSGGGSWGFTYTPPSSKLLVINYFVTLISSVAIGMSEIIGKHLKYSKLWNQPQKPATKKSPVSVSGRSGMLVFYTPMFVVGFVSFWVSPNYSLRVVLVKSAIVLHFFKRIFEVLFIHKYSGGMAIDTAITVGVGYLASFSAVIYEHHLAQNLPEPELDLKYLGILVFLLGNTGNFYHHYLLSKLRSKGSEKIYKIPKGGMFNLVICPHYFCEIITFFGFAFISQALSAFCIAIGTVMYLMCRSYVTRKWYVSKFEDFPVHVKALFPYVF